MKTIKNLYLSGIYVFLYLPIAVVIAFSFNHAERSLIWHGFTWHWYQVLFHDAALFTVALHSLAIGIASATIATFLGMIAAVSLYRYRFFGKKLFDAMILLYIIVPDLVLAIALLIIFNFLHMPLGFFSLLIAHSVLSIPFAIVIISTRLSAENKHLIEAAQDLGATQVQLYQRVLIPLLLPGFIAAWLLCFTLSLDDVIMSFFVSGPSFQILPLKIYSMVRMGVKPEINALCTVLLLITGIMAIGSHYLLRKKS